MFLISCCGADLLLATGSTIPDQPARIELAASELSQPRQPASRGGEFELRGGRKATVQQLRSFGAGFELATAVTDPKMLDGCACLCQGNLIFLDGFESGNTSAWSTTVGD